MEREPAMSLFEKGAIAGIGETAYSRASGKSVAALQMQASLAAIADAGLSHKEIYGTTSRQFAEIAVTSRRHAILNGNAMMKKPLTIEEHQASRMISDPFRLYDCSLESDGGCAIVVSAAERARDLKHKPVYV